MKRIIVAVLLLSALLAVAVPSGVTVQVTHLSATEVGLRCTAGGKMTARRVADMTIFTCSATDKAIAKP